MRTSNLDKLVTTWDEIGSAVARTDDIVAYILIDEIRKRFQHGKPTSHKLYFSLLEVADKLNVRNPFRNREDFILAYKRVEDTLQIEWEALMAQALSLLKKPQLPKAFVDNVCRNLAA